MCDACDHDDHPAATVPFLPVNATRPIPDAKDVGAAIAAYTIFLQKLGFDLNDPNMKETPVRVTKMYLTELFAGCFDEPPKVTLFDLDASSEPSTDEVIAVGPIPFKSMCSHHLMPIYGNVHIGIYLNRKVYPGLSKYARIVQWFARRPQIQEQFTQQLHDYLFNLLGMEGNDKSGIIVVVKAKHMCMSHRGPNVDANMTTSALSGTFRNPTMRAEFFNLEKIT